MDYPHLLPPVPMRLPTLVDDDDNGVASATAGARNVVPGRRRASFNKNGGGREDVYYLLSTRDAVGTPSVYVYKVQRYDPLDPRAQFVGSRGPSPRATYRDITESHSPFLTKHDSARMLLLAEIIATSFDKQYGWARAARLPSVKAVVADLVPRAWNVDAMVRVPPYIVADYAQRNGYGTPRDVRGTFVLSGQIASIVSDVRKAITAHATWGVFRDPHTLVGRVARAYEGPLEGIALPPEAMESLAAYRWRRVCGRPGYNVIDEAATIRGLRAAALALGADANAVESAAADADIAALCDMLAPEAITQAAYLNFGVRVAMPPEVFTDRMNQSERDAWELAMYPAPMSAQERDAMTLLLLGYADRVGVSVTDDEVKDLQLLAVRLVLYALDSYLAA